MFDNNVEEAIPLSLISRRLVGPPATSANCNFWRLVIDHLYNPPEATLKHCVGSSRSFLPMARGGTYRW